MRAHNARTTSARADVNDRSWCASRAVEDQEERGAGDAEPGQHEDTGEYQTKDEATRFEAQLAHRVSYLVVPTPQTASGFRVSRVEAKATTCELMVLTSAFALPQHPDQHGPERPVLLAVDQ